jgi:maltose alpha-D-glucosyltransferase/alpha-amylase
MYGWYAPDPRMRANIGIRRPARSPARQQPRGDRADQCPAAVAARFAVPVLRRRDRHGRQHLARRPRRGPDADAVDPRPQRRLLDGRPRQALPARSCSRSSTTTRASTSRLRWRRPSSLLHWTRGMLAARRQHPVFGLGRFVPVECDNPHVLRLPAGARRGRGQRRGGRGDPLREQPLARAPGRPARPGDYVGCALDDVFGGTGFPAVPDDGQLEITMGSRDFFWLKVSGAPRRLPSLGR